jgi:predicted acylesterase/phospholipase RssA
MTESSKVVHENVVSGPERLPDPTRIRIGLCLSGGGFRATFFHLGVVKCLWDAKLLANVVDVCSVSGGSVLAAKLALDWDEYVRQFEEGAFYRATLPLVKLAKSDMRGRIVRRWILMGWAGPFLRRTRMLEQYYAELFTRKELGQLPPTPRFYFLGTSLTTGKLVAFSREGFDDGTQLHKAANLPVALAVTASSAFPPLFPPVRISRERLGARADQFKLEADYITDGGIFDNLGVARMSAITEESSKGDSPDFIIVSNASAPFDWAGASRFSWIVSRTARATDILMKRVGLLEEYKRSRGLQRAVEFSIEKVVEERDINDLPRGQALFDLQDQAIQKLVAQTRTDFDAFSLEEICSLIRHGYEVCLSGLLQERMLPPTFEPNDPCVVHFPDIGWPENLEAIETIKAFRAAFNLGKIAERSIKVQDETNRVLAALGGRSFPPSVDDGERTAKIKKLRGKLKHTARRRIGLWHASDWLSWLLFPILGALALGALIGVKQIG